jgi:DNA modification methylase
MAELITDIHCGDCLEILRQFGDDHFDLIVTSPPYADSRDKTYGGIKPENYVKPARNSVGGDDRLQRSHLFHLFIAIVITQIFARNKNRVSLAA